MGGFRAFVLVGGAAALLNIGVRILLGGVMSFGLAVVVAYLVAMTFAFVLNRRFVFAGSRLPPVTQYLRFAMVNVIALGQVWLVSLGLARVIFPALGFGFHAETVAHVIGVASPVVTSYFLHKHFSFGQSAE